MESNWKRQPNGTFVCKNRSGEFTINEKGVLIGFVPDKDNLLPQNPYPDIEVSVRFLIIPEGVSRIGWISSFRYELLSEELFTFTGYYIAETLVLPKSLWFIGSNAFSDTWLPLVELGDHIKVIRGYAFSNSHIQTLLLTGEPKPLFQYCWENEPDLDAIVEGYVLSSEGKRIYHDPVTVGELLEGHLFVEGRHFKDGYIDLLLYPECPSQDEEDKEKYYHKIRYGLVSVDTAVRKVLIYHDEPYNDRGFPYLL